jgi:hypothetical protein
MHVAPSPTILEALHMDKRKLDTELLALEKQYRDAIKNKDGSMASRLSDDRCVVVGPQGIGEVEKHAIAGMIQGQPSQLKTCVLRVLSV